MSPAESSVRADETARCLLLYFKKMLRGVNELNEPMVIT